MSNIVTQLSEKLSDSSNSRRNFIIAAACVVLVCIMGYIFLRSFAAAPAPSVPGRVTARTGGNSIAVIWDASTGATIKSYEVYRDSAKVATLTVGEGATVEKQAARTYIDKNVAAGKTYKYQVRAISTENAASPLSSSISATHPQNTTPLLTITLDATAAPEVKDFFVTHVLPEVEAWYPKVSDALAYPDFTPPTSVNLVIDPNTTTNVATVDVTNQKILINAKYAKDTNFRKEFPGTILHELTHHINGVDKDFNIAKNQQPTWYSEAVADWTRNYFTRERLPAAPKENTSPHFAYGEGAYFLNWIEQKYDSAFIRKAMIAQNNKTFNGDFYSPDFARKNTGRSISQLWREMRGNYISDYAEVRGIAGKCLNMFDGSANPPVTLQDCHGKWWQKWVFTYDKGSNNTGILKSYWGDKCLDVAQAAVANGTRVQLWSCNGTTAQQWVVQPNGTFRNTNSGRCLDAEGGRTENGTGVIIWDCHGGQSEQWNVPFYNGSMIGIANKCVDIDNFNTANGTTLKLWDCSANKAQEWSPIPVPGKTNTYVMRALGKCMDVVNGGTTSGTRVQLWECNGSGAQEWVVHTNGGLKNPRSGRCLQTVGGSSTSGALLEIRTCATTSSQKWFTALSTPAGTL